MRTGTNKINGAQAARAWQDPVGESWEDSPLFLYEQISEGLNHEGYLAHKSTSVLNRVQEREAEPNPGGAIFFLHVQYL